MFEAEPDLLTNDFKVSSLASVILICLLGVFDFSDVTGWALEVIGFVGVSPSMTGLLLDDSGVLFNWLLEFITKPSPLPAKLLPVSVPF